MGNELLHLYTIKLTKVKIRERTQRENLEKNFEKLMATTVFIIFIFFDLVECL